MAFDHRTAQDLADASASISTSVVHTEPFLRLRCFGIPKNPDRFTITPFLVVPDDPGQAERIECSHTDNPLVHPQEGSLQLLLTPQNLISFVPCRLHQHLLVNYLFI